MRQILLPSDDTVPAMGQGTWFLGDDVDTRGTEIRALQEGIDLGLSLIDTAEMYGDGRSEQLVGEAIAGRRDDVFLVSKVLPSNASYVDTIAACEASLERLRTDCLDLYLLHWQGATPFEETISAFERLQADGKIRHYGVSNLDLKAIQAFIAAGGERTQVNQLLYNLNQRGIEWSLIDWQQRAGIVTMAYSPFDGGALAHHDELARLAAERKASAGQIALAWLLHQPNVLPIPKSANPNRVAENARAIDIRLSDGELAELDRLFVPPVEPEPLQIY